MDIHRQIVETIESGRPFAVGLVLEAGGSTPREVGVKALIDGEGRIAGTLGGGAVEAEAQRCAIEACRSGRPVVFGCDLAGEVAAGHEPICGGSMRLLVDPTAGKDGGAYEAAATAVEQRRRGLLLTAVYAGNSLRTKVLWLDETEEVVAEPTPQPRRSGFQPDTGRRRRAGSPTYASSATTSEVAVPPPSLPFLGSEELGACLATGQPRLFAGTAPETSCLVEVLVEPIIPNPLLLIAGGGHIGQALAQQAALLGFDVTVLDDRPEFADSVRFPEGVKTRCSDIAEELSAAALGPDTYVVIVTRGHQHDAEALRACVGRPAAYLGMIGSRRKVALLREAFLDSGWATGEEFDRVCAPIGLDIGAETVPEIATSIAAQLVAVRRKGRAERMPRDDRPR